jgi:cytochrome c oxidase accessory protein FixG
MTALEDLAAKAAGPAVETIDVQAVNAKEKRSLYKKRVKIHPKRVQGSFRRLKWIIMAVTLGIYYLAPWIRWDRGANAPDQAILIDFPARRFYFFFIEIWPQEVYYLTGLLILAALALFLITSLAGRVWCGYTCPQTVWTDLFVAVERFVEGDRNARLKLDRAHWNATKISKRVVKHTIWLLIAVATGGAWIFYFADAPRLAGQLVSFDAPAVAYVFIAVFTFTTYALGGIAREQVCTYMCPWPRIQGAMFDEDSYLISYRDFRGEPRGSHKKGQDWEDRGHCIDCNQCVAACPMGIDIRDGDQLECIQCALCIDACDSVMDKVGLPRGLIAYDTFRRLEARAAGRAVKTRIFRPRTIVYAALILVIGIVMTVALASRGNLDINVLRDRNPVYVTLSDGSIRNGYTVKILNKRREARTFEITAQGLPGARVSAVGLEPPVRYSVKPDALRSVKVFVTAPDDPARAASHPVTLVVRDIGDGNAARYDSSYKGP